MEVLAFLFGSLLACGVAFVPFVLPIWAMRRTRRLPAIELRLSALEEELASLRAENASLRRDQASVGAEPATSLAIAAPAATPLAAPVEPPAPEAAALDALDALALSARREAGLADVITTTTVAAPAPLPLLEEPSAPAEEAAAAAPTAPAAPPPAPPEPPVPRAPINWEQWLGVRGAAVLGGIVLALSGILFVQYGVQHGLISPSLRVAIGTLVGVGCIVGSMSLRRYATSANALAGGGAVILYAAFWAARALYQLIPMEAAFALMALVTASTSLLAARYSSLLIASLGLAGGFLTPLLLSTGANRPIGLFGYLLVLDAGFLVVAYRRRWAGLALFALVGTLFIEALWIGKKMEPEQLAIGLGATGLFALLFLASGARAPKEGPRPLLWVVTQAAAILLPHAFALYFAVDAQVGQHLYPVAILLLLLEVAALYLAATAPPDADSAALRMLPTMAGAGTLAVVASWLGHVTIDTALAWEAVGCVVALCAPALIAARRRPTPTPPVAALLYPGGLFFVIATAALGGALPSPWPYTVGLTLLAGLVLVQADETRRAPLALLAPLLLGGTLALLPLVHDEAQAFPRPAGFLLVELLLFIGMLVCAIVLRGRAALGRRALEGALALGALALLGVAGWEHLLRDPPLFVFGASLLWALLLVLAAVLRGHGLALVAAALPLLAVHAAATAVALHAPEKAPLAALACCALAVLLFAHAPFLGWPRLRGRIAFYVSALAGLTWLLPALALYRDRLGAVGQGGVALIFAAIGLSSIPSLRRRFAADAPERKSALVWVAAAALGLLSIAIPLELERQWITIGYALEAAAVLLLWRHLDHAGLKYLALGLAGAVGVRLVANPSVLVYADRGGVRILNWILYTYWVPVLALLHAARSLGPLELERLRGWEIPLYRRPGDKPAQPIGTTFLGLVAILVVFVWLNLAIADWFGTSNTLTLDYQRRPARDLTTSIVWALYAIVLLALGVWRRSSGLRWMSLMMLVVTIGKVFLYDLGQLKDLYRVVSLLGLAVSLILVSLAYQRFVFRRGDAPSSPEKS